jgi:general secretion pathway protein A
MLPVYCDHFGLVREPFSIAPDPTFLYLSESHREALAQLVYGIKARRGFVVLTGEVGTGKTTLLQCLFDELNGKTKTALIFNFIVSPQDLLRYICEKFGLIDHRENQKKLHDYICLLERFLLESFQSGMNVALIIDEAQNLSAQVLENVRLLSNFETKQEKLLQILLVGQPELGERLNQPDVRQIKQRVALRHHLSPLNLAECEMYIAKRLEIAGGSTSLFPADTSAAVHKYSAGIPRLVNILCDNGLLTAYASRKASVEPAMIGEVARELQINAAPHVSVSTQAYIIEPKETPSPKPKEAKAARLDQSDGHWLRKRNFETFLARTQPIKENTLKLSLNNPGQAVASLRNSRTQTATIPDSRADLVPSSFFDNMICALTDAMGPMAGFVVQDHVAIMGESIGTFPRRRIFELINEASREILDDTMRLNFQQIMLDKSRALGMQKNA